MPNIGKYVIESKAFKTSKWIVFQSYSTYEEAATIYKGMFERGTCYGYRILQVIYVEFKPENA